MGKITTAPVLNQTETTLLGKKYDITIGITAAIKFDYPVEVLASDLLKRKKTAVDEVFVTIRWQKNRRLIVQSDDAGGEIVGFTDPKLDKVYKQKIAKISEASIDVALDAYHELLLKLLEY